MAGWVYPESTQPSQCTECPTPKKEETRKTADNQQFIKCTFSENKNHTNVKYIHVFSEIKKDKVVSSKEIHNVKNKNLGSE